MLEGVVCVVNPERGMIGVKLEDGSYSAIEITGGIDVDFDLFGEKIFGNLQTLGYEIVSFKEENLSVIIQNMDCDRKQIVDRVSLGTGVYCSNEDM